jgi:hypothetical protein
MRLDTQRSTIPLLTLFIAGGKGRHKNRGATEIASPYCKSQTDSALLWGRGAMPILVQPRRTRRSEGIVSDLDGVVPRQVLSSLLDLAE